MKISFIIFISGLVTTIFTIIIKKYSTKFLLFQRVEDGRGKENMVRLGGVAIFVSFCLTFIFFKNFSYFDNDINLLDLIPYKVIFFGATCIFIIGLIDDFIYLSPKIRLILQLIIGIIVWIYGLRFGNIDISFLGIGNNQLVLPPFLNILFSVMFLAGMTNAINWIDGLDGLAIGYICIVSLGIAVLLFLTNSPYSYLLLPLCLGGCSLGFLFFNFYPAKIYMGDGGSNFLGFMIASLVIMISQINQLNLRLPTVCFLNALPVLNMLVVIFERLLNNLSPFYPDQRHIHHKIMKFGISHKKTVILLNLVSLLFVLFSIQVQMK